MGDMRTAVPRSRLRATISFWALAGVALLVSHDAVFAVQAGPGQALTNALRGAGHDYWGLASAMVAAIGVGVLVAADLRLRRLRRRARQIGAPRVTDGRAGRILRLWGWLFLLAASGFLVQENLEHLGTHGHLIGAGALLGPEYPLALPVIAGVTLVAGFVGALIGGAEAALLQAIAIAMARLRPRPSVLRHPLTIGARRQSVLARRGAGRAPPVMAPTT